MEFFIYLIKVNIAIILMYGFYGLLVREDTFFRWKRVFLLSIPVIAMLFPLVDISWFMNRGTLPSANIIVFPGYYLNEVIVNADQGKSHLHFSFVDFLWGIYWLGVAVLTIRILAQIVSVFLLLHRTQKTQINGQTIYRKEDLQTPFSFFRYIVLDPQKYPAHELQEIIRHEGTHVRQCHSLDVMVAEFMTAFLWFNPFIWLMKREIRMNLEYLADLSVVNSGLNKEHYQFHLMRLTSNKAAAKITNNFNVSPLKKRIFMMNKKETPRLGLAKYMLILPVIAVLLFFNYNVKANDSEGKTVMTEEPQQKVTPVTAADEQVYTHVEQMPQFPGGDAELMKWLNQNMVYPKSAQANGIQGRVILRFIIRKDGSIDSVRVVRTLEQECDAEAVRAVQAMPMWIPGKQNGQPVAVYFNLPIQFKLSVNTDKSTAEVSAHKSGPSVTTVYEHVEQMPHFPGGEAELMKWLSTHVIYPKSASAAGIQGRVVLKFVIRKDGSINDIQIAKSLDQECDAEAVRVVQAMPMWIPGKQNGNPVDCYFTFPVTFKLSDK